MEKALGSWQPWKLEQRYWAISMLSTKILHVLCFTGLLCWIFFSNSERRVFRGIQSRNSVKCVATKFSARINEGFKKFREFSSFFFIFRIICSSKLSSRRYRTTCCRTGPTINIFQRSPATTSTLLFDNISGAISQGFLFQTFRRVSLPVDEGTVADREAMTKKARFLRMIRFSSKRGKLSRSKDTTLLVQMEEKIYRTSVLGKEIVEIPQLYEAFLL